MKNNLLRSFLISEVIFSLVRLFLKNIALHDFFWTEERNPESQERGDLKPGNHPNFGKNALGVKRPLSEQLSEFRAHYGLCGSYVM